jgi:uncharacterized protein YjeT (DUF2065 family)
MDLQVALTVALSLLLGFLSGLLAFNVKQRWCRACGATLTCPDTTYHVGPSRERMKPHDSRRNAAPEGTWQTPTDRRTNAVRRTGEGARQRKRSV